MITANATEFLDHGSRLGSTRQSLTMSNALLIRPNAFGFADESAQDNVYMDPSAKIDRSRAMDQHAALGATLEKLGVKVHVFDSLDDTPDAVYPNNVFAFTPGHFIIGNMLHKVRRREAEHVKIRDFFLKTQGRTLIDLSNTGGVAELTGSMIIDHARSIAFTGLSQRCDLQGAEEMHKAFRVELSFVFPLTKDEYHTNIALSVLAGRAAVIAPESFQNPNDVAAIKKIYGNAIYSLSVAEKNAFVGNCLAVTPYTVMMSTTAYAGLSGSCRQFLRSLDFDICPVDVTELEKGGGSLRCLIAEVF